MERFLKPNNGLDDSITGLGRCCVSPGASPQLMRAQRQEESGPSLTQGTARSGEKEKKKARAKF